MSGNNSHQQNVINILDRPNEPIFTPKGDNGVVFNVPDEFVDERFKDIGNRFGSNERVPVKPITIPDSLKKANKLPKDELFSLFIPSHREIAGILISAFVRAQSFEDMMSMIAYCRGAGNVNSALLNYAVNVAILNRPDTKDIDIPPLSEFFPAKYIDGQVLRRARQEAKVADESGVEAIPLEIPLDYTASNLDPEHRVAYFREDLGINLHHWHWHLVYPFSGPENVIRKDRRGELFYYMHEQLIARYNFERFSNGLPRVARLLELRSPLPEGYFPKLDSVSASRVWASRTPNSLLKDIDRNSEQLKFDILELERWRDRLYEAVQTGRVVDSSGNSVQLTEQNGIDILGNLIESSDLTLNRNVYGDLHNLGHVAIAFCHDPDHRYLETFSVMGDSATAMRDPIFYRWHAFIDHIFQNYKRTLPPYSTQQLSFNGIRITELGITSEGGQQRNEFRTFWQKSDANLTRGMDFTPRANVFARFTHLQHAPFQYTIRINNSGAARRGTVRIFLGPKFDERRSPFLINDQRTMMIELDKFVVDLKPGDNNVPRRSSQSSVTIPFERTFRNLENTGTSGSDLAEFNYCGCGWPQHMLIPKGHAESFDAVLFAMVTNFEDDQVPDQQRDNIQCRGAVSYCGIRDSKYPDRKPMGFPFDRTIQGTGAAFIDNLDQFLTPNMRTQDVKITFSNRTVLRPATGQTGNQQGNLRPAGGQQRPNRPKSPNPRN